MADAKKAVERPLSPFMIGPYYRPQITSISSIMVRITGIVSIGTAFLVVLWLLSAATSEGVFNVVNGVMTSWFGNLILIIAAWALWYHMLGRLRHVIWDFGYGLDIETSETLGKGMFVGATVLTILTAIIMLIGG